MSVRSRAGIPLLTGQQAAYLGACLILAAALRPLVAARGLRFAVFVWLAFNPATFGALDSSRVLRNMLAAALALAVVALALGVVARLVKGERSQRLVPWAAALGVVLGMFWLTREESVWIMAVLGLLGLWQSGTGAKVTVPSGGAPWSAACWAGAAGRCRLRACVHSTGGITVGGAPWSFVRPSSTRPMAPCCGCRR